MTVRELIERLEELPQEYDVIYHCCSDYSLLEEGEIEIQTPATKLDYGVAIPHHNLPGQYRSYGGPWEYGPNEKPPTPANVVILPGN